MLRLFVFMTLLIIGLFRSLRLHVPVLNEAGSPETDKPFEIKEPNLSKAIYGTLKPGKEEEYYTFFAEKEAKLAPILLLMAASYNHKGLRATFRLSGPGLPAEGVTPDVTAKPLHIVGHDYIMVQSFMSPLPETGDYHVAVQRTDGAGLYCFCIGTAENNQIDPALFAKVAALVSQEA
ncbi:MAG: hypothetical protein WCS37_17450 [Chloroflexota bacterium]|nr:hypothetical protein [Chloroflexota bacterium]